MAISNESRVIDIDILLYGETILNSPSLTIPHREMLKRKFVLAPLDEIAPHLIHPIEKKPISYFLKSGNSSETVTRISERLI